MSLFNLGRSVRAYQIPVKTGDMDTQNSSTKKFHSVAEVAEILGLSRNSVWGLVGSGRISAKRVGRRVVISDEDVQTFFKSCPDYLENDEVDRG